MYAAKKLVTSEILKQSINQSNNPMNLKSLSKMKINLATSTEYKNCIFVMCAQYL